MNRPVRGLSFLSISVLGRRTILATLVALLILPATSRAGALFEVNTFSVSGVNAGETNTGTTVDFLQSYDVVPMVFVLDNTADSKVALRVTNVTKTGFDVYQVHHSGDGIANPAGEDLTAHDVAANSDLTYFVIVPGTYNVNGATIEAGSVQASGNRSYESITFDSSFAEEPSVLTNIQTMNNETLVGEAGEGGMSAPWRVTMMPNDGGAEGGGIKTTGFRVALDQMQVNDGVSAALDETIGWVAVSAGHGTLSSDGYTLADALGVLTTAEYDSQITANAVANGLYTADFTTAFPTGSSPIVLSRPCHHRWRRRLLGRARHGNRNGRPAPLHGRHLARYRGRPRRRGREPPGLPKLVAGLRRHPGGLLGQQRHHDRPERHRRYRRRPVELQHQLAQ